MTATTPQDGSNRREQRRTATRERLLTAALELFAAQGYAATTYDHIAERADVGRQTAFNHFRRKEDFVTAWVRQRHELLTARGAEGGVEDGASAVDALADALRALAELNEQEYALAKELHDSGVLHSAFGLGAVTPPALLAATTDGWDRGEIRAEFEPGAVADLVFDTYVTALSRWLSAGGDHSLTEALLRRLDILANGFTAR